jgi:hypothetical protein
MSSINLQGLINQVLSMAQASINSRGNPDYWSKPSWDQLKEENYWTEMRKRNTQLEVDKQKGGFDLEKQKLANTGQLEQAKERTAGEIARQTLANEGGIQQTRYKSDTDYLIKDMEVNKGYDPELIKAHAAVIANVNSSPEAVASSQAAIDWYTKNAMKKQSQARQGLVDEQPAPAAAIPAPATPAATKPAFSLNDLTEPVGSTLVNGIAGKNPPTDFNDFKISKPAAPQSTTPSIPATGAGGAVGRVAYGITHPFETAEQGTPITRAESPFRKASDQFVFDTAPKAVANTARAAVMGVQDFGQNVSRGYDAKKAEEEAKKKRKALY